MNSKELILKKMFGENENEKYAGYDGICIKLIETGKYITTIESWNLLREGGLWNFVRGKVFEDGINLIELMLDKECIYNNEYYKQYKVDLVKDKTIELNQLQEQVRKLEAFINELL
jgi:hypothetical protein